MRVAIIAGEVPSPTFIQRLIDGLAKETCSVIVVGKKLKPQKKKRNVSYCGENKYLGSVGKLLFKLKYEGLTALLRYQEVVRLKKIKDKPTATDYALLWHKPQVVHVQWAKSVESVIWVQSFGIKVVLSLRGAHINYSPLSIPGLAESYLRVFPKVDAFHGVSKAICHEATKYGADFKKCRVVYSGFNLNQFPVSNWKNDFKSLPDRPIQIISVGRAHWKKGYHIALDAMRQLKDAGISFQYTIIGALGDEELLFQKNQLNLDDVVDFSPNVPFSKVKEMIGGADVFLLPSLEEGIANVVIEAMLLGTLVITTDCGGMIETVTHGETGWVVPVRNPQAIAQAIKEVKNTAPEALEKMLIAARKKAEEQHNEEGMVSDMLELYQSVIENGQ